MRDVAVLSRRCQRCSLRFSQRQEVKQWKPVRFRRIEFLRLFFSARCALRKLTHSNARIVDLLPLPAGKRTIQQ
jgi:hypothetical protein